MTQKRVEGQEREAVRAAAAKRTHQQVDHDNFHVWSEGCGGLQGHCLLGLGGVFTKEDPLISKLYLAQFHRHICSRGQGLKFICCNPPANPSMCCIP